MDDLILNEKTILLLSVLALISALLIIVESVIFGRLLHQEIKRAVLERYHLLDTDKMLDLIKEFLERTNEFWIIYGQIALATFIVAVLFVLLLTRTISSEAGLPILSAVSGFAIAKGASINRSSSSPLSGPKTPPEHPGENNVGNDKTSEKEHKIVDHGTYVDIDGLPLYKRDEKEHKIVDHGTYVDIDGVRLYKRGEKEKP